MTQFAKWSWAFGGLDFGNLERRAFNVRHVQHLRISVTSEADVHVTQLRTVVKRGESFITDEPIDADGHEVWQFLD